MENQSKLLENPEDIRLNDNLDLQQILGSPPGWILRWGITVVMVAVIILGIISYMVKYSDDIDARVTLTTEYPPIRVVAKVDGKIDSLSVLDKQEVRRGALLAVIENPADQADVEILNDFLKTLPDAYTPKTLENLTIPRNLKLGTLQQTYADLINKYDSYQFYLKNNITRQKIKNLERQNRLLDRNNQSIDKQRKTYDKIVKLAKKELERNEKLKQDGLLADAELETFRADYLEKEKALESMKSLLNNNNLEIQQNKMKILEEELANAESESGRLHDIEEVLQNLRNGIKTWEQLYLVTAPISGIVSLTKFWSPQQYIKINEELLTIVPTTNSGKIIGKAQLPVTRSGKVEPDMKANIRLDGYPYQEFGILESKVVEIAPIPQDNTYEVILDIPPSLVTTYGKEVPFRQEMQGTAKIITEERRIIERIFDKILSILKNR